jgi:hypothetical protein
MKAVWHQRPVYESTLNKAVYCIESIMETNNRQLEWNCYHSIFANLYTDLAESIGVPSKESQRDLMRIKKRFESEGLGFVTKTLPSLGKALDRAINRLEPLTVPTTFLRKKIGGVVQHYPNLFGWLFQRVIGEDGWPLPMKEDLEVLCEKHPVVKAIHSMDVECLRGLRQLVYFLYKLEMPHEPERERELLDGFVTVDKTLATVSDTFDWEVLNKAALIANAVFWNFDPADIRPRHGPGAVATGEGPHEKHVFRRLYTALEGVYPFMEYFKYSLSDVCDTWVNSQNLETMETGTAKVVFVPKDSRGPRIISCEPLEYQWIQQGLGRAIVRHLETCRLTAGRINFTDQTVNQRLALQGSVDDETVTLDMKEASDRVSTELVKHIFRDVPQLCAALLATRSTHTELPDGRIVHMNKFAPMGSNLCFPVEAFVFWVLGVASIIHDRETYGDEFGYPRGFSRTTPLRAILRKVRRCQLHVYGDDIIVGKKYHRTLLNYLPRFGLMFNVDKCCIHGSFRESCGVDAYRGHNVTPLRLKRRWCHRTVDANTIASYVEFSNLAYERGYKKVASYTASLVEEVMGFLPITNRRESYLSFVRPSSVIQIPSNVPRRFNKNLQGVEYRVWSIRPLHIEADPDSWCMVLRVQSTKEDILDVDLWEPETAQVGTPTGVFALSRRSCLKRVWTRIG